MKNGILKAMKQSLKEYNRFYILTAAAIFFKIIVYAATSKLNFNNIFDKTTINIFLSAAASGILLPAILLMSTKRRPVYFLIMNIIVTGVIIADTWFGRYYYTPLNIKTMLSANLDMIGTTTGSIGALFKAVDILYIIDFPLYIYFLVKREKNIQYQGIKTRALSMFAALFLAFVMIGGVLLNSETDYYPQDNNYFTKNMGVVNFHLYDVVRAVNEKYINKPVYTDEIGEEIKRFFKENQGKNPQVELKYHSAEKGKNIIIVQMEALQHFVVGLEIEGREVTPNINKLLKDSIYFDNIYVQTAGGNTSDAEFLANVSMYPAREGSAYARFNKNKFYSLPVLLKNLGYESNSFHANKKEFWSRDLMYKILGFKKYYSVDDYVLDELYGFDGTMLSDKSFYRQTLSHIEKNINSPYYCFLVSLSSHHPFTFFEDTHDFDVGKYENTNIGNYLKSQHYSDYALGTFIEALKKQDLYDDTLLIVYGDHTGVVRDDKEKLLNLLGKDNNEVNWISEQKVPLIIKGTNLEKNTVIKTTGGQIDIMPTILNLMGIEGNYVMGRDLLNTNENFVIFRDGSFIKDNIYYMQGRDRVYDMGTGKILNKGDYADLIRKMRTPLKINDMILTYDALRHID